MKAIFISTYTRWRFCATTILNINLMVVSFTISVHVLVKSIRPYQSKFLTIIKLFTYYFFFCFSPLVFLMFHISLHLYSDLFICLYKEGIVISLGLSKLSFSHEHGIRSRMIPVQCSSPHASSTPLACCTLVGLPLCGYAAMPQNSLAVNSNATSPYTCRARRALLLAMWDALTWSTTIIIATRLPLQPTLVLPLSVLISCSTTAIVVARLPIVVLPLSTATLLTYHCHYLRA